MAWTWSPSTTETSLTVLVAKVLDQSAGERGGLESSEFLPPGWQTELSYYAVSPGKGGISFRVPYFILIREGFALTSNHLAKAIAPMPSIADVLPEFESGER